MPSSACDWSSDVCSSDRSEEHTSELQSRSDLVCRLLLEKKKKHTLHHQIPVHTRTATVGSRDDPPAEVPEHQSARRADTIGPRTHRYAGNGGCSLSSEHT